MGEIDKKDLGGTNEAVAANYTNRRWNKEVSTEATDLEAVKTTAGSS